MAAPIRVVRPADLVDADPTVGMRRRLAFAVEGLWVGLVHTDAGAVSGWHHHGEHDTGIYLLAGGMRLDFGAGGSTSGARASMGRRDARTPSVGRAR